MNKTRQCFKKALCFLLLVMLLVPLTGALTNAYAAPDIKLNVKSTSIIRGRAFALKVYNTEETQTITFSSSDDSIASVEADGVVLAISCGSATINVFVTNEDGSEAASLQCEVTVGLPAISVKFTKSEVELTVGMRRVLKTLVQPGNSIEKVKFYSEDTQIATISGSGRVVAKSAGTTYIHAILSNGKYDTCVITVTEPEPTAEPTPSAITPVPETDNTTPAAIETSPSATPTPEVPIELPLTGSLLNSIVPTNGAEK